MKIKEYLIQVVIVRFEKEIQVRKGRDIMVEDIQN